MKNEYYQKFTELKKREPKRIELDAIGDFEKLTKEGLKMVRSTDNLVDEIKNKSKKAIQELNKTGTLLVKVYPAYQKLEQQAKNLGVDLPKDLKKEMEIVRSYIKNIDKDIKNLKSIF